MRKGTVAAIAAAFNAYMQQEEDEKATHSMRLAFLPSPWKFFGRQEQMRKRLALQQKARR